PSDTSNFHRARCTRHSWAPAKCRYLRWCSTCVCARRRRGTRAWRLRTRARTRRASRTLGGALHGPHRTRPNQTRGGAPTADEGRSTADTPGKLVNRRSFIRRPDACELPALPTRHLVGDEAIVLA